ncbi:hypothetical protein GCM10010270_74720 [Streptomyces violaceus]|nr:hypothetical protein GCM10010270_74720 [Streptomyces janthinus]
MLSCVGVFGLCLGVGESVGLGAGLDDGAVEGEPVDDGRVKPRICEGLRPLSKRFVGRDGDAVLLRPLRQDLEQQLGTAAVQLHVAELVDA